MVRSLVIATGVSDELSRIVIDDKQKEARVLTELLLKSHFVGTVKKNALIKNWMNHLYTKINQLNQ